MLYFNENILDKVDQMKALQSGFQISNLLNRTIILPKFLCKQKFCNFHDLYREKIKLLDDYFGQKYREHMFLRHPLVPQKIKKTKHLFVNISTPLFSSKTAKNSIEEKLSVYANVLVFSVYISKDINFNFERKIAVKFKIIIKRRGKGVF